MSGIGDLAKYYYFHKVKPLSPQDKAALKAQIDLIIDQATDKITLTAVVEAALKKSPYNTTDNVSGRKKKK